MLKEILKDVKANGLTIKQIIMDHDTSSTNIACTFFPEISITYCRNHTAKSFHSENGNSVRQCWVLKYVHLCMSTVLTSK